MSQSVTVVLRQHCVLGGNLVLGDRLRKLRTKQKFTQEDMSRHLGITRPAYTQYETGVRKPDPETLAKLADKLDVSIDYLVTGRETEQSMSRDEQEFIEWVSEVDEAFFYDFHKSPEEQKRQFMETMRALWEVEKKRGNIKPKE